MRAAPSPPPRDPEFDRPPSAAPILRTEVVVYYQRLVVNPFLALLCASTSLAIGRWVSRTWARGEWVVSIAVVGLVATCLLFQYHCLDCGETGPFHRWDRHACPRVRERSARMHVLAHRFPTAAAQFTFWIFVLLCLVLFLLSGPGDAGPR